jgi:chromosome segregation ATPase
MAETDAKRTKINELLEYIESRLTELEEEKEELRGFQEKDKERRCLEYALYQRELEEVGEALEEIEEERRGEVHGANMRREQFDTREKDIQVGTSCSTSLVISHGFAAPRAKNVTNQAQSVDSQHYPPGRSI